MGKRPSVCSAACICNICCKGPLVNAERINCTCTCNRCACARTRSKKNSGESSGLEKTIKKNKIQTKPYVTEFILEQPGSKVYKPRPQPKPQSTKAYPKAAYPKEVERFVNMFSLKKLPDDGNGQDESSANLEERTDPNKHKGMISN